MNNLSDFANFSELHILGGRGGAPGGGAAGGGAPDGSLRPGRQKPSLRLCYILGIYIGIVMYVYESKSP